MKNIQTKIILLFVVLNLALFAYPISANSRFEEIVFFENRCFRILDTLTFGEGNSDISPFEVDDNNSPALRYQGINGSGNIVFVKTKREWKSAFKYGQFTEHGDSRIPMALFNRKLSNYFGFKIKYGYSKGQLITIYEVPGASKIGAKIDQLNRTLKQMEKPTIPYKLLKRGTLSHRELFDLVLKSKGEIIMHFPFDDTNPLLVQHDISFHLGAIVFPRFYIKKGQQINLVLSKLIEFTSSHTGDMEFDHDLFIDSLVSVRSNIIDTGTANITSALGHYRLTNPESPSFFKASFSVVSVMSIFKSIELFSAPSQTPLASVVLLLCQVFDIDTKNFNHIDTPPFKNDFSPKKVDQQTPYYLSGSEEHFNKKQKSNIIQMVNVFIGNNIANNKIIELELINPDNIYEDFFRGVDENISNLEQAIDIINSSPFQNEAARSTLK